MADKLLGAYSRKPISKKWAKRFVTRLDELKMVFNRLKDR